MVHNLADLPIANNMQIFIAKNTLCMCVSIKMFSFTRILRVKWAADHIVNQFQGRNKSGATSIFR